jgi:hypothetical protein
MANKMFGCRSLPNGYETERESLGSHMPKSPGGPD